MDLKIRAKINKKLIADGKVVQTTCGCIGTSKALYAGGGSHICEHYNFATVFPEWAVSEFWKDERSPKTFVPSSNKEILMACKLRCGSPPYNIKLCLYIRNLGCDGCHGNGIKVEILYERCILSDERMAKLWSPNNKENPRNVSFFSNKDYLWKCENPAHEEWSVAASYIRGGGNCKKCLTYGAIPQEVIKHRFEAIHGEQYTYDWSTFINTGEKMTIICKNHGPFTQLVASHLRGHGCQICVFGEIKENLGKGKISPEAILERCRLVWDKLYEYKMETYTDTQTPFEIVCYKHGTFEKTFFNHIKGQGCPSCGLVDIDELLIRFEAVFGNEYTYDWDSFINTTYPITIICSKHGKFQKTPHHHASGQGCQQCSAELTDSKLMRDIKKYLTCAGLIYVPEKWYDDLRGKDRRPYRYDIWIESLNLLIEGDGKQHWTITDHWGGEEAYNDCQRIDAIKDSYAVSKNINIIRIPYWASRLDIVSIFHITITNILRGQKVYASYEKYSKNIEYIGYLHINWISK